MSDVDDCDQVYGAEPDEDGLDEFNDVATPPRVVRPAQYLTEAQILERWPMLTKSELRKARKSNPPLIAFYAFHRRGGGPRCTPEQVQEYIDRTYKKAAPCPSKPTDSRSGNITSISPTPTEAAFGTPAGMTPELAQRAAAALAQQMSKRQRSPLPRSSQQRRGKAAKGRLALVKS